MATNEQAKPNLSIKPPIPKVMMGRGGYMSNEERIQKDEEEFAAMKKAALEGGSAVILLKIASKSRNTSSPNMLIIKTNLGT